MRYSADFPDEAGYYNCYGYFNSDSITSSDMTSPASPLSPTDSVSSDYAELTKNLNRSDENIEESNRRQIGASAAYALVSPTKVPAFLGLLARDSAFIC